MRILDQALDQVGLPDTADVDSSKNFGVATCARGVVGGGLRMPSGRHGRRLPIPELPWNRLRRSSVPAAGRS